MFVKNLKCQQTSEFKSAIKTKNSEEKNSQKKKTTPTTYLYFGKQGNGEISNFQRKRKKQETLES